MTAVPDVPSGATGDPPPPRRHRARWAVIAAAGLAALILAAVLVARDPAGEEQGGEDSAAPTRVLETGVEVFSLWRDWAVNTQMLDAVAASGSGWVRLGVGWCSLEEAGPGLVSEWYQGRLDATVAEAARRGLRVLVTVACTPGWLSGSDDLKVLPTDVGQYERVVRYLAARYAGRVAAWEIWNEPDCVTGTCPEGDPAAYVGVLRAGYAGVKAGDPQATVVSGGISGANAEWIGRMYAAGGGGWFDALGIHPYQGPAAEPPEAPPAEHPYRITNVERVREVMTAHGDGGKPIWFTEFGWTTGAGEGWSAGVDELTQADYLRRAITMVQQRYGYVTHAFVFTIRDRDDWSLYENNFGLVRLDGTPKAALAALRTVNGWLADQRARGSGRSDDGGP